VVLIFYQLLEFSQRSVFHLDADVVES
jgi:hypothetical protein